MARRSLAPFIFVPIVAYLAALVALAAFSLHPPLLGWIGLGLLCVFALALGELALVLVPRMGTNARRLHPHPGAVYRLLVVSDAEAEDAELLSAVRLRLLGRRAEVRVVAPVLASGFHFLAAEEGREQAAAQRRLEATLGVLADAGIPARGEVGTDEPLQALGDALAEFPADEVLFVGSLPSRRLWPERDFEHRARDLFGVPVATVYTSSTASDRAYPAAHPPR